MTAILYVICNTLQVVSEMYRSRSTDSEADQHSTYFITECILPIWGYTSRPGTSAHIRSELVVRFVTVQMLNFASLNRRSDISERLLQFYLSTFYPLFIFRPNLFIDFSEPCSHPQILLISWYCFRATSGVVISHATTRVSHIFCLCRYSFTYLLPSYLW
jgi:hypothetical protein